MPQKPIPTKVSLEDVSLRFDALISQTKTREEVAAWAKQIMKANDDGILTYQPTSQEQTIWKAIVYLSAVDLQDSPTNYLHDASNFIEYRKSLGL